MKNCTEFSLFQNFRRPNQFSQKELKLENLSTDFDAIFVSKYDVTECYLPHYAKDVPLLFR